MTKTEQQAPVYGFSQRKSMLARVASQLVSSQKKLESCEITISKPRSTQWVHGQWPHDKWVLYGFIWQSAYCDLRPPSDTCHDGGVDHLQRLGLFGEFTSQTWDKFLDLVTLPLEHVSKWGHWVILPTVKSHDVRDSFDSGRFAAAHWKIFVKLIWNDNPDEPLLFVSPDE